MNNNPNLPISGAYFVEIKFSSASQKIYFGDIPVLKNKSIVYIDAVVDGKAPSGTEFSRYHNAYITLCNKNGIEVYNSLPCDNLTHYVNKGTRQKFSEKLDLTKTYVFSENAQANKAIGFVFYYNDPTIEALSSYFPDEQTSIESLEIPVDSTHRKFFFPDKPVLNKRLHRQIFCPMPFSSVAPSGLKKVVSVNMYSAYVTLLYKGKEVFSRIPAQLFFPDMVYSFLPLHNILFDVTNSYVEFAEGVNPTDYDAKVVLLNFEMKRK